MSTEVFESARRFMNMKDVKSKHPWMHATLLGLLWLGINTLFDHLQASPSKVPSLEMQLIGSGHATFWWLIVLAYFIADLSMWLIVIYFLGKPMPKGFPFWYYSLDIAVFVFLMHSGYACIRDAWIYDHLYDMGLQYSYLVFGVAAGLWTVGVILRHRSMKKRFFRDSNALHQ